MSGDCLLRHRWVMVLWLLVTAAMWLWEWVYNGLLRHVTGRRGGI